MIKQIKSFKCAFEGIRYTVLNEAHMRFHIVVSVFVIVFGVLFELSAVEWAVLILTISAVTAFELVNTACEKICNLYSKEKHPLIKIAKDVSAGAVLISALGSIGVAWFLFIKPDKIFEVFYMFWENPIYIILLCVGIILGILFILKCHGKNKD